MSRPVQKSMKKVGDRANDGARVDASPAPGQGRGRRRQPRLHPKSAHRIRLERRSHQHRRGRQFGGRGSLRSRSQFENPDGDAARASGVFAPRTATAIGSSRNSLTTYVVRCWRIIIGKASACRWNANAATPISSRFWNWRINWRTPGVRPLRGSLSGSQGDSRPRGQGLTRPELAVLMAHAKLALKRALLEAPSFLSRAVGRGHFRRLFSARARDRYAAISGITLSAEKSPPP